MAREIGTSPLTLTKFGKKAFYIMREQLLRILTEAVPGVDFDSETALVDNGILESLDIVTIVSEIMDVFDIALTVDDLTPENFNTIEDILKLINSKQEL